MRSPLLPALLAGVLLAAVACGESSEKKEARIAAEEHAKSPEVRKAGEERRARAGLPPGGSSSEELRWYRDEAERVLDSLLTLGDSTLAARRELYRYAGISRRELVAELQSTENRIAEREQRSDSLTRELRKAATQATQNDVSADLAGNVRDRERIAWIRRHVADPALPP